MKRLERPCEPYEEAKPTVEREPSEGPWDGQILATLGTILQQRGIRFLTLWPSLRAGNMANRKRKLYAVFSTS
jgi:hypothetical protein